MIVLASVFFYLKWFASALQVVKRCHIYVTHLQTTLLITTNCVGVSYSFFVEEPIDGDIELHLILTFFLSFVFSLQYLMEDWFVDFMVSNILETTMFIISAFLVNIYKNFAKREILLKYLHKNYLILTELRFDCVVYIVWNIKQTFSTGVSYCYFWIKNISSFWKNWTNYFILISPTWKLKIYLWWGQLLLNGNTSNSGRAGFRY